MAQTLRQVQGIAPIAAAPAGRRPRVLVVDDDEHIRGFVSLALLDEGYDIVTAANGALALERAVEYPPDVIVLDLNMPVMDGWTFAERYRELPVRHAPIVVCTAGAPTPAAIERVAPTAYLNKPFDLGELVAVVERHACGSATGAA